MPSSLSEPSGLRYRGGSRHHLWQKRGIYYLRYSICSDRRFKADRRRCLSLRTTDLATAISRRETLLATLTGATPRTS